MADPAESPAESLSTVSDKVPPMFETSRLRLRPWRDDDDPGPGEGPDGDSLRFMPAGAQPGPADFPAWLARRRREMDAGGELHWCIADLASDAAGSRSMLGNIQIFRMGPMEDRSQGELGYWLRPGARGRGVMGEALGPVIAHAFTPVANGGLGLTRLHAATDSDNQASHSILRSGGFTQWGADHQGWRRADGSLSDGRHFELLASWPVKGTPSPDTAVELVTLDGAPGQAGVVPGVRLRKWRHGDAARVVEACADERSRHWLATLPSPYTIEDAHTYIGGRSQEADEGTGLYWCVADPDSDECLGSVALMSLSDTRGTAGEVGYWAHPDARDRGVMTEAVRMATAARTWPPQISLGS